MTKKSTRKKSSSTRRKRSTQTKKNQSPSRKPMVTVLVIVGILLAAGLYYATGVDPLGLFTGEAGTATPTYLPISASGDWWQVYFTDPAAGHTPENLSGSPAQPLIELINGAQSDIHIAAFEFNLTPVAEALIRAHERGVEVLWVTDDEHGIEADEEEGHGQFAMLEDAGIEVRDDGRTALMHNKFWIFDQQTVWTGSTNITVNGMFHNNNNVIVIQSPALAAIYEREFDEMWAGEFGPRSSSTLDQQALNLGGTPIRVLFAAEDEVASQLTPLIADANQSVRFMAFSFTHDDLENAVLARARAGLDVKGIFEARGSEAEYSALPSLYCAGVPVRQDGNPRTFHHKVFIIDGETVVTGSFNFSNNADESNDENVIIITNADIAAQYLQEFERRWAEANDPDPADMNCK